MTEGLKRGEGRWKKYEEDAKFGKALDELNEILEDNQLQDFKVCRVKLADDPTGCYGKDCLDTGISLPQDNVARYWAQTQLCGWWDEAEDIGNRLLAAFGPDGGQPRAILKPDPDDGLNGLLWFLLELYSRVKEQPIEPGALPSARFSYPYADVLQSWNTDDLDEVDRWISILSENHLKLTTQGEGFTSITSWLFPYEIPAWLTARQKQGLENPAEYSHPLMQQPLAEFIPDTPLDKPDIPQVETLLQIVRNTLPAEAAFIDLGQAPANHE